VLSNEYRSTTSNAVIVVNGDGVRIRNVRILGADRWDPRWEVVSPLAQSRPGVFGRTVGIRMQGARDVAVEQVSIEGLPSTGIFGFGVEGGLFRDITIRHCFSGINLQHNEPNRGLRFERIHTMNQWGPKGSPRRPEGDRSLERPGGWMGGDGLALSTLRDSILEDCTSVGEMYTSFKFTNPQRVTIRGFRGASLMVQGTGGAASVEWSIHPEPARDVVLEDCIFDKGIGRGASLFDMNCIQLSQNIERITIRRCVMNAAGQNGHAIQMTRNVQGRVTGCTIRGFNGMRGLVQAHAIDLVNGSSVNADFGRVNQFVNQSRILVDRN
jgi:polygalacturonase